jgi:hypothetical protein
VQHPEQLEPRAIQAYRSRSIEGHSPTFARTQLFRTQSAPRQHSSSGSCSLRQQQQHSPKRARHPIARTGSRSHHAPIPNSPCSLSRPCPKQQCGPTTARFQSALVTPEQRINNSSLRRRARTCPTAIRPTQSTSRQSARRNHEPAPAEQGGPQRTSLAAPAHVEPP